MINLVYWWWSGLLPSVKPFSLKPESSKTRFSNSTCPFPFVPGIQKRCAPFLIQGWVPLKSTLTRRRNTGELNLVLKSPRFIPQEPGCCGPQASPHQADACVVVDLIFPTSGALLACLAASDDSQSNDEMISLNVTPVLSSGGTPQSGTRQEKGGEKRENHVWSHSVTGARCCSCSTFLSSAEKTHSDPDNLRSRVRCQTLACCVKVCVAIECQNWVTLLLKMCRTSFCCWAETEPHVVFFSYLHNIESPNKSQWWSTFILLLFFICLLNVGDFFFFFFLVDAVNCVGWSTEEKAPSSKVEKVRKNPTWQSRSEQEAGPGNVAKLCNTPLGESWDCGAYLQTSKW